jgi:opacity protein-like surface antigen
MKRTLSGLAALTLFDIASAHAQTPPLFSWTGYYLGGHAGFRYDEVTATGPYGGFPSVTFGFPGTVSFPVPAASVKNDSGSGVIGLQGGYNLQFSYNYLVGLEGDFSWGRAPFRPIRSRPRSTGRRACASSAKSLAHSCFMRPGACRS